MAENLTVNKAKIQFIYPFRVNRWGSFRYGIEGFLDERDDDLFDSLRSITTRLKRAYPKHIESCTSVECEINDCVQGEGGSRKSNASIVAELEQRLKKLRIFDHDNHKTGSDLFCSELAELSRDYEAKIPERIMDFVRQAIDRSAVPVFSPTECRLGDDRGTRAYFERKQPYVDVRLRAESLAIANPESIPDIAKKLPAHSPLRGKPSMRLASSIRLGWTGFGCLRIKAHLANEEGLRELVNEIVFTAPHTRGKHTTRTLRRRAALAQQLEEVIVQSVKRRSMTAIKTIIDTYRDMEETDSITKRLECAVDSITVVKEALSPDDLIDIENLDRGSARGYEPLLVRKEATQKLKLDEYFKRVVNDTFLANFREALLADSEVVSFLSRTDRRKTDGKNLMTRREQLMGAIPGLALHRWSLSLEEHPYVSTFISAPKSFKRSNLKDDGAVEHFRCMVDRHRGDFTKLLMKSKWAQTRSDWQPAVTAMENVFYSDLIHMSVHIRSTLCLYYTPSNPQESSAFPELANACKYREELNDTLQRQRILWYAYVTSDHLVTRDIRRISAALETLKEQSLREEFPEVIEGLADVIRGIDRRKMALAEIMEDPLSRKGGNSLFTEIIEKTSSAFHLRSLYETLRDKVERLDMLGIHVSGNVQEYSNLLVQEGSRSAQLTLEFLEAIIIGYYVSELAHNALPEMNKVLEHFWWPQHVVAVGAFLTALPLITLIRKGRSRFSFKNPVWLEEFERIGIIVGPAILLAMLYLALQGKEGKHMVPMTWVSGGFVMRLFVAAYILVVLGWFHASEEGSVKRLVTRVKRAVSGRGGRGSGKSDPRPPAPQEAVG
ncbi:MAG: hypothetical protein ACYC1U_00205 [Candidatus Aquicultorales bacterium]